MPSNMVREVCKVNQAGQTLVKKAMEKLQLSARAYARIQSFISRTRKHQLNVFNELVTTLGDSNFLRALNSYLEIKRNYYARLLLLSFPPRN
jgi:hypothetical protein